MKSIQDLIEKLIANPNVVGLMEYGGARYQDEKILGDYDLFVFLTVSYPDVESIHFYVDSIPVDLNIKSLDDIRSMQRAEGFYTVLIEGRIIHDPRGEFLKEIQALQERHEKSSMPKLSTETIGRIRHGGKHTFDKLRDGRYASTTLGRYLLHQVAYCALREYFLTRCLPYKGEKHALNYLQKNEPDLHQCFEQFYATIDFTQQMKLAEAIDEKVLAPIGGPWRNNEIVTFGDHAKGEQIFDALFG